MDVYKTFYHDQGHIFIPCTNRVLANHGKYILGTKGKYFLNKISPPKPEFVKIWSILCPCRSIELSIGNEPSADPPCQIHRCSSNQHFSFLLTFFLTRQKTASTVTQEAILCGFLQRILRVFFLFRTWTP